MKRLGAILAAGVLALTACKKSDDSGSGSATASGSSIQHGKGEGKGTGGGGKSATGAMNGKAGTGKEPGAGTASGTAAGTASGTGAAADPVLARGRYLATNVAACVLCHTPLQIGPNGPVPDSTKMFAGGFSFKEAFGTWVSPNITPDPDTGIGKWTDEQIIAAVRQGASSNMKTALHPIMPWPYFSKMTDDDAKALVAFLRTLPPVANKIPIPDLQGRPPQPMPAPTGNTDPKDDPVKHGEYLASLMHCGACHTPITPKGQDMTKAFAGGNPFEFPKEMGMGEGTVYASNITSDPDTGIGTWSEDDIIKALRTLTKKDGTRINGPMAFYVGGVWNGMTDEDIADVAKWVKTIPAVKNKVPANTYKPPAPPPGGGQGGAGGASGSGSASGSAAPKVEHGKQQGPGTGGGNKQGTGSKNGTKNSAPATK